MRFTAAQHLRRPAEIRVVREQGQRLECRAFTLWWKRRAHSSKSSDPAATGPDRTIAPTARVCVIASTAAVGNAVHRNRAKRRLREIFRNHQSTVPSDCDLLLIARRAVNDWPMSDLETKFTEACRQITPDRNVS